MEFRKAVKADVLEIMEIIKDAQDYLKEQRIDQWQNGYPNIETIIKDIEYGNGYVLVKDSNIVGYVVAVFGEEKSYEFIYERKWLSSQPYVVIHRLAIDSKYKGLGLASIFSSKRLCCFSCVLNPAPATGYTPSALALSNISCKSGYIRESTRSPFDKTVNSTS